MAKLDPDKPFGNKNFLKGLLEGMRFEWKLYGVRELRPLKIGGTEVDLDLGSVHLTEKDLKQVSALMRKLNRKWKTKIMFCIFHTRQFPDNLVINIRSPAAPGTISPNVRYSPKELADARRKAKIK